jgi:hypothetical protein
MGLPRWSMVVHGGAKAGGGGGGFSPFATTLFGSMTPQPDNARKVVIDTFIRALVSGGIWGSLDALYVFAAHDEQAALLNWVNPGTFDATAVNAPTFTTDRGFTGNGTDSEINSGFNLSTDGTNYVLDSATVFARALNNLAAGVSPLWGTNSGDHYGNGFPRFSGDITVFNCNTSGGASNIEVASSDGRGFWSVTRSASDAQALYLDGSGIGTGSQASATLPNATLRGLRSATTFGAFQIASLGCGAHLDATKQAALASAESAYMEAVGAVV